ncbi:reverse transcriptase domain-containing protein [Paenibacillus lentus]|nr:reverse transcriptase domain-containing protein [Paenibacillus lentus]
MRLTTPKEKVQQLQEKLGHAAKENKKRKFHALYDKIHREDILREGCYSDNINEEKLMKLVKMRISDRRILEFVRKWLGAGVMEEGSIRRSDLGTPQGGVISPMLANIYLNYFDLLWKRHGSQVRGWVPPSLSL